MNIYVLQANLSAGFPKERGTYALIMRCYQPGMVQVGSLGQLQAAAGWYIYVGSALGSGGLSGRLVHHLDKKRIKHWHIDRLKSMMEIDSVWYVVDPARLEHAWAGVFLSAPGLRAPWPRFGSSDCTCPAHLFYTDTRPAPALFNLR